MQQWLELIFTKDTLHLALKGKLRGVYYKHNTFNEMSVKFWELIYWKQINGDCWVHL